MLRNLLNTKLPLDSPNQTFQIYLTRINFVLEVFYYLVLIFICISGFALIFKGIVITKTLLVTSLILYLIINLLVKKFYKEYKKKNRIPLRMVTEEITHEQILTLGIGGGGGGGGGGVNNEQEEPEENLILIPVEPEENLIENNEKLFDTKQHDIDEGVLDFELIEKDIEKMEDEIKQENFIIERLVTINKPNKFIEITINIQIKNNFLKYQKVREFKNLSNLPSDVETELEKNGSVTLNIHDKLR